MELPDFRQPHRYDAERSAPILPGQLVLRPDHPAWEGLFTLELGPSEILELLGWLDDLPEAMDLSPEDVPAALKDNLRLYTVTDDTLRGEAVADREIVPARGLLGTDVHIQAGDQRDGRLSRLEVLNPAPKHSFQSHVETGPDRFRPHFKMRLDAERALGQTPPGNRPGNKVTGAPRFREEDGLARVQGTRAISRRALRRLLFWYVPEDDSELMRALWRKEARHHPGQMLRLLLEGLTPTVGSKPSRSVIRHLEPTDLKPSLMSENESVRQLALRVAGKLLASTSSEHEKQLAQVLEDETT